MITKITGGWTRTSGSRNKKYYYVGIKLGDGSYHEIRQSRFIAAKAMGKSLPAKAVVHHIDYDSLNDLPSNLVVCENDAYHKLLHLRTDALKATGNPHARRCRVCKKWGVPGKGDLVMLKRAARPGGEGTPRHKSCHTKKEAQRQENNDDKYFNEHFVTSLTENELREKIQATVH